MDEILAKGEIAADARRGRAFLGRDHVETALAIVSWQCGINEDGTSTLIDNKRVLTQNIASALAAVELATLKRVTDQKQGSRTMSVITVTIFDGNDEAAMPVILLSDSAVQRARVSFNPANNPRVHVLKVLVAALYSELEVISREGNDTAKREAATAMTQLQSGAMFAVSAATAN